MHLLFFLLPFIFFSAARADTLPALIQEFSQGIDSPQPLSCQTEHDLHQCAIDLCGPPDSKKNLQNFLRTLSNDPNAVKTLLPGAEEQLTKLISDEKIRNQTHINSLRKKFTGQGSYLDSSSWQRDTWDFEAMRWFGPFNSIEVDHSKPISERLKFTLKFPENADASLKAGVKAYVNELKAAFLRNPASDPALLPGAPEDLLTLAELKNQIRGSLPKLKQELQRLLIDPSKIDKKILQEELAELETKVNDPKFPSDQAFMLARSYGFLSGSLYPKIPMCTEACHKGIREVYDRAMNEKLKTFEAANNDPLWEQRTLAKCLSSFLVPAEREAQVLSFKNRIPGLLNMFIGQGMSGASSHSKAEFEKFFYQKMDQTFGNSFDSAETRVNRFISERREMTDFEPTNPAADLYSICDSPFEPGVTDHYDPIKNSLGISPFSCAHQVLGENFFLHELGHALSHALQKNLLSVESKVAYLALRSCAVRKHPSVLPPNFRRFDGDNLFSEEDTADLIAYRANPSSSVLFSCSFLDVGQDGTYSKLSLQKTDDPHSSDFSRLLKEAINKKRSLPDSCKGIVANLPEYEPCI